MVSVAIETGAGLETTFIQQASRKVPSLEPRDAATSRTTATKRVLDIHIPRRDAGENTLETASGTENEIESESETTSETANAIVCRSTRGLVTVREKRRTAARIRNGSTALRRAPLLQGSAREAGVILEATRNRKSLGVPGVLGESSPSP